MGSDCLEVCHVGETVGNNRRRSQPPFMKDFLKGMFQRTYLLGAGPSKAGISKRFLWISFCTSYGENLRDTAKKALRKDQETIRQKDQKEMNIQKGAFGRARSAKTTSARSGEVIRETTKTVVLCTPASLAPRAQNRCVCSDGKIEDIASGETIAREGPWFL